MLSFGGFQALVSGAFAVAMLGAIESLLSAVVADGMARTKHDPDAELISLGIGNLIVPFFAGIPATGAIARTATNVKAGACSPVAAMTHAVTVLAAVLALAPPPGVAVYEISGPLFFGAAQKAMAALEIVAGETKVVVLLMDEVHAMDATGLVALESAVEPLSRNKCLAILSGVREQPMVLLKKSHLDRHDGVMLCANAREAIAAAGRHVAEQAAPPTGARTHAP